MTVLTEARNRPLTLSLVVGAGLVMIGVLLPGPAFVAFLRSDPGALLDKLLLGATFFKLALILLGVAVVIAGRTLDWDAPVKPAVAASSRTGLVVLLTLLAVATGLRLYRLGEGLWYDEILTYVRYVGVPFGETISTFDSQNQHFLFTLMAHAATLVFGDTAWALRLPSVLFGVASLGALYLLGREVTDARETLLAVALLTFSYQHVWFSQNARGYMGLFFWSLLSSWFLVRGLRDSRPITWLLYAVAAALGMYTHMTMLFVLAAQALIYLAFEWSRWRRGEGIRVAQGLLAFGGLALLTFTLYALVLPQFFGGSLEEKSTVALWNSPLWTMIELVRGLQVGAPGIMVMMGGLLVVGLGLWSYARTTPVVVGLLLLPALLCTVVTLGLGHPLWPRFFFFLVGFAALVVVRGLMVAARGIAHRLHQPAGWGTGLGVALCLGLILIGARSVPWAYAPKQDYDGARTFVEAQREPGDAVVMVGLAGDVYEMLYQDDWQRVRTLSELHAIQARAPRTWLIYTTPVEVQSVYPEIMDSINRDFQRVQLFSGSVGDGTIFVYRADRTP